MSQNIYDNDEFFAGYAQLPRSRHGLEGAPEWPALQALLPALDGKRVLDLGCGYGWFCRWAREAGATRVVGVDISDKMLARARADTADAAITYRQADLEMLDLAEASFDLVYSSLTFHYIGGLDRLLARAHAMLVPRGRLVFSAEHPIYTAPAEGRWSVDTAGGKHWPLAHYLDEGPRSRDWMTKGVIKYHRTLATYINLLLRLDFSLLHVEEWRPSDEQIAAQPSLADERHRPMFFFVSARR
jgi:SAM-dependent methyltransferase